MIPTPFGSRHACPSRSHSQRGQAVFLIVLLLAVGIGLFAYGAVSSVSLSQQQDLKTRLAFVQVRDALIGWSVARTPTGGTPNARPGELPCPDIDNTGNDPGGCSVGAIGRVPWKSLGIPEPKDGAGETLWYAIAGPFRYYHPTNNPNPIHSDTKGNLTVYQDSTASAITTEAVAVLFAPGAAQGTQNRDPAATALCPTTGTTIARNLCAANYLETAAGVNNSTTNGPFISALSSDTFNDMVFTITTADLMPIVEQRVAREVLTILENYRIATGSQGYNGGAGVYPWADCTNGTSDITLPSGSVIDGSNRGRIPWNNAVPVNWNTGIPLTPTLPNWLTNQGTTAYSWIWTIYYAVGKNYLENFGAACGSCVNPMKLTVVGDATQKKVVIIMTGPAGANRPQGGIGSGICDQPQWAAYLEDPENNDLANDTFVRPSSTAFARDRLYDIPAP